MGRLEATIFSLLFLVMLWAPLTAEPIIIIQGSGAAAFCAGGELYCEEHITTTDPPTGFTEGGAPAVITDGSTDVYQFLGTGGEDSATGANLWADEDTVKCFEVRMSYTNVGVATVVVNLYGTGIIAGHWGLRVISDTGIQIRAGLTESATQTITGGVANYHDYLMEADAEAGTIEFSIDGGSTTTVTGTAEGAADEFRSILYRDGGAASAEVRIDRMKVTSGTCTF